MIMDYISTGRYKMDDDIRDAVNAAVIQSKLTGQTCKTHVPGINVYFRFFRHNYVGVYYIPGCSQSLCASDIVGKILLSLGFRVWYFVDESP